VADSVKVTVPTTTYVIVSTAPRGRSYGSPQVNDTMTVDVAADMRFTPGDKLGSYNAKLTWNPAQLTLQAVSAGDGGFNPTYNDLVSGQLTFADANATGVAGTPVVARIRFKALVAGSPNLVLTLTELSASAPSYTNLFAANRVTVTNGVITVRP
jgi:hypothetical protein